VVVAHGGARPGAVGLSRQAVFGDGMDTEMAMAGAATADHAAAAVEPAPDTTPAHVGLRIVGMNDGPGSEPGRSRTATMGAASSVAPPAPALAPMPAGSASGGGGEISSANYVARRFGIHAGMSTSAAKRLCPHLVVLPYNFERIQSVSRDVVK